MAIKKDGTGNRRVEMEIIVPGTPEQVWHAMATGPGNTAWFTKAHVDERAGGEIRFEFGPNASSVGEVTTWDPPYRLGYVEPNWSEGAPPVATEITITSRSGGQCVVRMVHSLFASSDDWDDQMEGFESGWPFFFDVLRAYLRHFAGLPAESFIIMTSVEGDNLSVWKRLTQQLALNTGDAGDRATTSQPEVLSGVIERVYQHHDERRVLLRLDGPAPGIALFASSSAGARVNVSVSLYIYGDDARARVTVSHPKWERWFAGLFPTEGSMERPEVASVEA